MNKEEWEKSFSGYHAGAPAHLKAEAKKLKMAKKMAKKKPESWAEYSGYKGITKENYKA